MIWLDKILKKLHVHQILGLSWSVWFVCNYWMGCAEIFSFVHMFGRLQC